MPGRLSLCFSPFLSASSVMMVSHLAFFPLSESLEDIPSVKKAVQQATSHASKQLRHPNPDHKKLEVSPISLCLSLWCIHRPILSLAATQSQCFSTTSWMQMIRRSVRLHAHYHPICNPLTPGFFTVLSTRVGGFSDRVVYRLCKMMSARSNTPFPPK